MTLKIAYNDNSSKLVSDLKDFLFNKDIKIEAYHENVYRENKKALSLKYSYGTKLTPFAVLCKEETPITAFYGEDKKCTFDNIIKFIESYGS